MSVAGALSPSPKRAAALSRIEITPTCSGAAILADVRAVPRNPQRGRGEEGVRAFMKRKKLPLSLSRGWAAGACQSVWRKLEQKLPAPLFSRLGKIFTMGIITPV